jgi:hypothetical protein
MSTSAKWFVKTPEGETSGGFFDTKEAAEDHLARGLQMFAGVASEYRVVRGHVTFEEPDAALSE